MSSLPVPEAELVGARSARGSLRYLPHVLVATAVVSVLPIALVWGLRERGAVSSPWIALPLTVALSLLAAVLASAWWSRRRRADDLMFSELLPWGWLRRVYIDHQVERAVGLLGLADPMDQLADGEMTVERRTQLLSQLARALEAQDPYLEGHSRRVARHATMIARKIGLGDDQVARIRRAAVLHDVGKLRVPPEILNKPAQLTAAEFDQVKRHADEGARMVARLGDDQLTSNVRHHHERVDGTGYPDGLRGAYIPLGARIIAVADMYDAITAARAYRPAAPHKQALDTLREESLSHLDPEVVRVFRGCYSGRGPLVFWESVTASALAVRFFPPGTPAIARRVSVREVIATTLATAAVAVAAIAAPIGARGGEHHSPAPSLSAPVALTPTHANQPRRGSGGTYPAPALPARPAHVVVHRPRPSAGVPPATHRVTRTTTAGPGIRPRIAQFPSGPLSTGRTSPSAHPPSTTTHRPPRRPRPRPTSPRPPTTTNRNPPQATPATPTSGTTPTTTSPSDAPTSTPAVPPVARPSVQPASKDACKNGGYAQYGFSNQGQCVAAVEHGG